MDLCTHPVSVMAMGEHLEWLLPSHQLQQAGVAGAAHSMELARAPPLLSQRGSSLGAAAAAQAIAVDPGITGSRSLGADGNPTLQGAAAATKPQLQARGSCSTEQAGALPPSHLAAPAQTAAADSGISALLGTLEGPPALRGLEMPVPTAWLLLLSVPTLILEQTWGQACELSQLSQVCTHSRQC
nr:uncharacterized protein LOC120361479 [Saimiri boliviensis boliviensis]